MQYPASMRDPVPRGESYPISRQVLDSALRAAGVQHLSLIYFLRGGQTWRGSHGRVIRVAFRAQSRLAPEAVELRIYSVPSPLKRTIGPLLIDHALAHVAQWIADAERAGNSWGASDHVLVLDWEQSEPRTRELDGAKARDWYRV
jgi:hypothetical protein